MLYKTLSAAVCGIDASIIEVEVDISGIKTSEDHFHTVGLLDAAVQRERGLAASRSWSVQGSLRQAQGRLFDCALPSLREDKAPLRMTVGRVGLGHSRFRFGVREIKTVERVGQPPTHPRLPSLCRYNLSRESEHKAPS